MPFPYVPLLDGDAQEEHARERQLALSLSEVSGFFCLMRARLFDTCATGIHRRRGNSFIGIRPSPQTSDSRSATSGAACSGPRRLISDLPFSDLFGGAYILIKIHYSVSVVGLARLEANSNIEGSNFPISSCRPTVESCNRTRISLAIVVAALRVNWVSSATWRVASLHPRRLALPLDCVSIARALLRYLESCFGLRLCY